MNALMSWLRENEFALVYQVPVAGKGYYVQLEDCCGSMIDLLLTPGQLARNAQGAKAAIKRRLDSLTPVNLVP